MKIPDSLPAVDERIRELTENAEERVRSECRRCCQYARESPAKAMAIAAAAGYCLHWLPLRALLVAKIRITAKLLPPLLFVYGAAKACEIARACADEGRSRRNNGSGAQGPS